MGKINKNSIELIINNGENHYSNLSGKKVTKFKGKRNYLTIFKKIFDLTEKNLYKQSFIKTKQWIKFKKKMIKHYSNLIIDLRDNPGGNFLSVYPLSQYLISKPIIAGIFPNQKWYKQYDRSPNQGEYPLFTEFSGETIEANSYLIPKPI